MGDRRQGLGERKEQIAGSLLYDTERLQPHNPQRLLGRTKIANKQHRLGHGHDKEQIQSLHRLEEDPYPQHGA